MLPSAGGMSGDISNTFETSTGSDISAVYAYGVLLGGLHLATQVGARPATLSAGGFLQVY
jgi:hypothetical protein